MNLMHRPVRCENMSFSSGGDQTWSMVFAHKASETTGENLHSHFNHFLIFESNLLKSTENQLYVRDQFLDFFLCFL